MNNILIPNYLLNFIALFMILNEFMKSDFSNQKSNIRNQNLFALAIALSISGTLCVILQNPLYRYIPHQYQYFAKSPISIYTAWCKFKQKLNLRPLSTLANPISKEFSPIQLIGRVSICEEEIMRLLKSQSSRPPHQTHQIS